MQKFLFVLVLTLICLSLQLLCLQVFGASFVPNFVLIAVVFFNLYRGMRYSLGAAFLGGLFLDGFGGNIPGLNVFSLVLCAFLAGALKMYIYQPGVAESRVLMIFVIVIANGFLQYLVNAISGLDLRLVEAIWWVILPQTLLTTLVAGDTFERLRQCALKIFA